VGSNPNGDLERLYREHGARLWRALLAYAGDPDVASDALSEAFAQALRRGSELRDPMRWIWRVAFRVAAGELAAARQRGAGRVTEVGYEMSEPAVDLVRALGRLSPNQRAAVVLHHYAGYRAREIASIIGSTGPAVRVHLSAGRKRLRALLSEGTSDG
jgi:RNA polymerase sigma-70 factor, ECF subfamily